MKCFIKKLGKEYCDMLFTSAKKRRGCKTVGVPVFGCFTWGV